MIIRLYQLNERLNMILQTYRGFEDEETTTLMAEKIVELCDSVERNYPTESRVAGIRLAEAVRDNDHLQRVFCISVFPNFIRVTPHNLMGMKFPAEIIIAKGTSAPVK